MELGAAKMQRWQVVLLATVVISGSGAGALAAFSSPGSPDSSGLDWNLPCSEYRPHGDGNNHAPTGRLELTTPSAGEAPLRVEFNLPVSDPDDDDLVYAVTMADEDGPVKTALDDPRFEGYQGEPEFDGLPGMVAQFCASHGPSGEPSSFKTALLPGTYRFALHVSDGWESFVTEEVVIESIAPLDDPLAPIVEFSAPLNSSCQACSTQPLGIEAQPGAQACQSLLLGENGGDCVWLQLDAEMGDHAFDAVSTADVDVEFRTICGPDPTTPVSSKANPGNEAGQVPSGAGCVILWLADAAPADVTLRIW